MERARRLPSGRHVAVRVTGSQVQLARRRDSTEPILHLRLKCLDAGGKRITRDTAAVRWVLSYVAAHWHELRQRAPADAPSAQLALW